MLLDYVVVCLACIYFTKGKRRGRRSRQEPELHIRSFLVSDITVIIVDHGAPGSCGSVKPACQLSQGQLLLCVCQPPKEKVPLAYHVLNLLALSLSIRLHLVRTGM